MEPTSRGHCVQNIEYKDFREKIKNEPYEYVQMIEMIILIFYFIGFVLF